MADAIDTFARQQRLRDQLATSPVVEVPGVAAPSGTDGGRSMRITRKSHMLYPGYFITRLPPQPQGPKKLEIRITNSETNSNIEIANPKLVPR